MRKTRALRRLVPDQALYDRRAAGEPLRAIAPDYGVVHTTLSDFFRRSDAVLELRDAGRRLREKRKARRAAVLQLEQDVRRKAQEDEERDRLLETWTPKRPRRYGYEGWIDDRRNAPRGLTTRKRYSASDDLAKAAVEASGGIDQVIEATGLRTLENVSNNIDAQILRGMLANERKLAAKPRPDDRGLRRLVPDYELIKRRAQRETLRSIAPDYNVSHPTLSRYFNRPKVTKQLRAQHRRHRPGGQAAPHEKSRLRQLLGSVALLSFSGSATRSSSTIRL